MREKNARSKCPSCARARVNNARSSYLRRLSSPTCCTERKDPRTKHEIAGREGGCWGFDPSKKSTNTRATSQDDGSTVMRRDAQLVGAGKWVWQLQFMLPASNHHLKSVRTRTVLCLARIHLVGRSTASHAIECSHPAAECQHV